MTGSAQLEILPDEEMTGEAAVVPHAGSALKLEVAAKLAEHRLRRARAGVGGVASEIAAPARGAKNRVAAAVAERYAQTPSYRAFLAAEAERAVEQAAAAAEVARRNAEAVAAVQGELLAELEKWDAPQEFSPRTAEVVAAGVPAPVKQISTAGLTVRLYEDVGRPRVSPGIAAGGFKENQRKADHADAAMVRALDEEIAFRQAPVFEDYRATEPAVPIAANLLEFPRQLVAPVKARPRLAEGPLRDEFAPRSPQLRIFEVEPEQIATIAEPVSMLPEWSSIWLDAHTVTEPVLEPGAVAQEILPSLLPPQTASMQLRLMAAALDCVLVLGGFVAFAAAFARVVPAVTPGVPLLVAAAVVLVVLYLGYQVLFFSLSGQTPGMRYARIGLCTFTDENPSRSAMRKRVLAQMVAAAPLGLGLVWALLDDDRLGWHDRMSRMYQRAY